MKKVTLLFVVLFLSSTLHAQAATSKPAAFNGSGEVVTVDPVYSQVTIKHRAIKGFAGDTTTDFYVASQDMLKNIQKGDLVDFDLKEDRGEVKIEKIVKTGVAEQVRESSPLRETVQGVFQGTGDVVRGVTKPLPIVSEVGQAVHDTTSATSDSLNDAPTESSTKF